METKIAVQMQTRPPAMRGDARLYKLMPPLVTAKYDDVVETYEFVVVSAADVPYSGPETYIFPADEQGHVTDWLELDGSFRGSLDHAEALRNAGYEIAPLALN